MPEFKLPPLGENIESGDIVSVLVKEGDVVKAQQGVIEIETDKAVIEVPCTEAGQVSKVHVKAGDTVKVGATILTLQAAGAGGGAAPAKPAPAKAPAAKPETPKTEATKPAAAPKSAAPKSEAARPEPSKPEPAPASSGNGHRATSATAVAEPETQTQTGKVEPAGPAVRRLARELGIDLSRVTGTGQGGRIVREDVIAAVRHANATAPLSPAGKLGATENDSWGGIRREALPKIRKTIANNMVRSATTIPHVTNFDDADVTELERIRKESANDYLKENVKLTTLAFVMKAVALALRQHPTINATLDMENNQIIYKEYVNLGVAIDTPRGLVVPVIRNVDRMRIPNIAQGITDIATKAKNTSLSIDEMRGGTFTISNLGAVGGTYSTPIINHPEVAILLLGRSRKMPVVRDDKIEARMMMPLSLSYDHRLVDGATAARFLTEVIGYLQTPGRLLLAP